MEKSLLVFILMMSTILFGCQNSEVTSTNEKLSVVTSFYPMYEFARQVAGDRADVTLMLSDGEDPHHYEPSAKDVARVNKADVFVYSSEEMEYWVGSLLKSIESDKLVIARAADGLESEHKEDENEANHEVADKVKIHGAADHYHTGDRIKLTAELDEDSEYEHWHWYTRESADKEWVAVPNQGGTEFDYEASGKSFEVRAVLFDDAHKEFAQSQPVEIIINDHGHTHEDGEETVQQHNHESEDGAQPVEIIGLADHYHTGDVVTLVAELKEETEYEHWHWYTRGSHDEEWEAVSGQGTDHLEYKTTGESFEVKAVLFDDAHHTYAESEPVTVSIDDHESLDPHIWLDPVLAQEQVKIIRDALIKADPDGTAIYEKNAATFNEELQEVHEEYQSALEKAENRVFVVQHQAFGYIAERYNLKQIAIGGLSTEVEPSAARIAEIGNLVKEYDVPVIYYQQGANSAIAETVAAETGTETASLYDLEVLSKELQAENLGYVAAMRENLKALQISIQ